MGEATRVDRIWNPGSARSKSRGGRDVAPWHIGGSFEGEQERRANFVRFAGGRDVRMKSETEYESCTHFAM
jgi:hypothetical protein